MILWALQVATLNSGDGGNGIGYDTLTGGEAWTGSQADQPPEKLIQLSR